MVDLHTHILFRFDDGPKTESDSIALIKEMVSGGVTDIASTSHFYSAHMSMEVFAERRQRRREALDKLLAESDVSVNIYNAAEVNIDRLILNNDNIKPLTYEGTSYILLEIPLNADDLDENLDLIEKISSYYNVKPIIAHVERYDFFFKKPKNLLRLRNMGCLVQIDANCLLGGRRARTFALNAVKDELVDIVASDCHDVALRRPNLREAYEVIEKKISSEAVERLKENAESILAKK